MRVVQGLPARGGKWIRARHSGAHSRFVRDPIDPKERYQQAQPYLSKPSTSMSEADGAATAAAAADSSRTLPRAASQQFPRTPARHRDHPPWVSRGLRSCELMMGRTVRCTQNARPAATNDNRTPRTPARPSSPHIAEHLGAHGRRQSSGAQTASDWHDLVSSAQQPVAGRLLAALLSAPAFSVHQWDRGRVCCRLLPWVQPLCDCSPLVAAATSGSPARGGVGATAPSSLPAPPPFSLLLISFTFPL